MTYSKEFSNSIYGGLTMRIVSESISNVRASGVCFDAGIRYVTGENDGFGLALPFATWAPPCVTPVTV